MKKCSHGHILKNRIKEMGYTQQSFADKVGIPIETLKNILRGRGKYTVEWLEVFSRELDCSYDYLMGYTKTPNRDLQTVKDKISLSDEAISILQEISSKTDIKQTHEILKSLDALITDHVFLEYVTGYLYPQEEEKEFEKVVFGAFEKVPNYEKPRFRLSDAILTGIINELSFIKNNLHK